MTAEKNTSSILFVEDDKNVGTTLQERLTQEGFATTWCQTFHEAKDHAQGTRFDLALLDVGLPDGSGFELAKLIRLRHRSTAIIFLTAFGTPEDRIRGLELGAEDYIVKPFHLKELLLRVKNGLRRAKALASSPVSDGTEVGHAKIYFSRFEAITPAETLSLTHKECALLQLLVERRGQVISRDEILNTIWSPEEFPTSRTVDNFILRLRKIVEPNIDSPQVIRSVRGVGYQLI